MGYLLSIIAILVFVVVHFINAVVVIFLKIKARAFLRTTDSYFFNTAVELDIYGNYAYRYTWNTLMIKKEGYKFGEKWETISSALGKNQLAKSLSIFGWVIVYVLWALDPKYWFKGGHCINSIRHEHEQ